MKRQPGRTTAKDEPGPSGLGLVRTPLAIHVLFRHVPFLEPQLDKNMDSRNMNCRE